MRAAWLALFACLSSQAGAEQITVSPGLIVNPVPLASGFVPVASGTGAIKDAGTALPVIVTAPPWNAKFDGVTDDTAAIQAAIDYVGGLPNGGRVSAPCGTAVISATIKLNKSNEAFAGCAGGPGNVIGFSPTNTYGTRFLWNGASGGTMVAVGPAAYPAATAIQQSIQFTGVFLDGNSGLAGTALTWKSVYGGYFDFAYAEPANHGVIFDTVSLNGASDSSQQNSGKIVGRSSTSADGVTLDGTGAPALGNTSFNHFLYLDLVTTGQPCLIFNTADNNQIMSLRCYVIGTGTGVLFNGNNSALAYTANSNYIYWLSAVGGNTIARGTSSFTYASYDNHVFLDDGNGTPIPSVETGASLDIQGTAYHTVSRVAGNRSGVIAQIPDSGVTGGNARGDNSVDLQTTRNLNSQVAAGVGSIIMGGANNAINSSSQYAAAGGLNNFANSGCAWGVVFGNNNSCSGNGGVALGIQSDDRGRIGCEVYSAGQIASYADDETSSCELKGTTSGSAAIRLTADLLAAGSKNCDNIPTSAAFDLDIQLIALDRTTPTKNYSWREPMSLMTRGAGNAAYTAGTPLTALSNGVVAGAGVTEAADTTNQCLDLEFTPPTANTDTWDIHAVVRASEVR